MPSTRLLRHLLLPDWWVLRAFSPTLLRRIEQAVAASESTHLGELRVVVEGNLITGKRDYNSPQRGNGIQLYNSQRARRHARGGCSRELRRHL